MMSRLIVLAVLVIGAGVYFLLGPSVVMGGPSKSEIERVSREVMRATMPSPELAKAAETATLSPKGICNKQGEVFACMVDVSIEGSETKTFIAELRKDEKGNWVVAK